MSDLFGDTTNTTPGKTCTVCHKFKPFDAFHMKQVRSLKRPYRPDQRDSACKECQKARCRRYHYSPKGNKSCKKRRCKRYQITVQEYDTMYAAQQGACAICGTVERPIDPRTGKQYILALDHDHATGKVRELLCPNCNLGLGSFRDDPKLLQSAISYLTKHAIASRNDD